MLCFLKQDDAGGSAGAEKDLIGLMFDAAHGELFQPAQSLKLLHRRLKTQFKVLT